jgi:hypothetical protein
LFDTSLFLGTQLKKDLYQEITFTKDDIGHKQQVYDQWTRDEEEDITIWYYTGERKESVEQALTTNGIEWLKESPKDDGVGVMYVQQGKDNAKAPSFDDITEKMWYLKMDIVKTSPDGMSTTAESKTFHGFTSIGYDSDCFSVLFEDDVFGEETPEIFDVFMGDFDYVKSTLSQNNLFDQATALQKKRKYDEENQKVKKKARRSGQFKNQISHSFELFRVSTIYLLY